MEIILLVSFLMVVLSIAITLLRIYLGPHAIDRVLGIDSLSIATAALLSIHSIRVENSAFLDIVLILSIIAFLATVVFSKLIETNRKRVK